MKNDSDIGDNTAALIMVGGFLAFTAWSIKQMINLAFPPAPPPATSVALVTQRTQTSLFGSVPLSVERQTTEVMRRL